MLTGEEEQQQQQKDKEEGEGEQQAAEPGPPGVEGAVEGGEEATGQEQAQPLNPQVQYFPLTHILHMYYILCDGPCVYDL